MTTAKEVVLERIDEISSKMDQLIDRVNANSDLGTYVGRTVQNTVPSIIEMIAEIVKTVGDEELAETVTAKLAVLRFEQERFQNSERDD